MLAPPPRYHSGMLQPEHVLIFVGLASSFPLHPVNPHLAMPKGSQLLAATYPPPPINHPRTAGHNPLPPHPWITHLCALWAAEQS